MQQNLRKLAKGAIAAACLLLSPALSETAQAQVPITIGNPLSTTYNYQLPINNLWGYSYTQQILLSSDIGMSGDISKIRFKYNTGSLVNNNNWTVYLGYKSGNSFTSTTDWVPISGLTNVYTGTVTASGGWIEIILSTPFPYNVSSGNLIVAVDENSSSYTYEENMFAVNSSGSDYRAIHYRSDDTNPNPASPPTASGRLQSYNTIQLEITGLPCTGMPNPGATLANTTLICAGTGVNLSLENNSGASGLSYQWLASTDGGTTYSEIAGDTNKVTSVIPMVPSMYRARVICSSGPDTAYSTAIAIGFNANIDSVSTASVCGTGSTTLQAFVDTAVSVYWYDAPAGGTLLDSGNSFTTPVISVTTTYYAEPVVTGPGEVTVGAGTMTSVSGSSEYSGKSPFTYHYGNYKHQMLVKASDLTAAGLLPGEILSLAFVVTGPTGSGTPYATFNAFTVSLKETTASAMTATFETGTSVVWTGNYTPVTGVNTFTFTTPFIWDGTSNIIVQTCYHNDNSGNMNASAEVQVDPTSYVSHTIYRADGSGVSICNTAAGNFSNDGPTISNLPKMIFGSVGGCAGPRMPVVVNVGTPFTVDLGADTTICAGEMVSLDATGPSGATYSWSTGETTASIDVVTAGTYSVMVSSGSCMEADTIVIDEAPAPIAGTIVVVDNMPEFEFSAPGTTGAAMYAWDFGDGATATTETASHTYTENGVYTVTFVATNACGQTGSVTTTVMVSGLGVNSVQGMANNVQVYPNPSNGLTVVEAKGALISNIEVMDNLGRVVLRTQPNSIKTVIDVKGMAKGIYTLRIQTDKGMRAVKLVVGDK